MIILMFTATVFVYINVVLIEWMYLNNHIEDNNMPDKTTALSYSIIINTFIVLMTSELLSLFNGIKFESIFIVWVLVNLVAVILGIYLFVKSKITYKTLFRVLKPICRESFSVINFFILINWIIVIFMAICTVPYNWDSMSYHLTRIAHWTQNGSIAHYVCHDISQISGPPLAEIANLHVYILSGKTDYFVNLLQTFCFVFTSGIVYKISMKIGCKRLFSSLAALVYITTPIVFAEAMSTQVDLYSALWLVVFINIELDFIKGKQELRWNLETVIRLFFMGMSAGFCYLAKPSGCIAIIIFAIWLLTVCIQRKENTLVIIKSILAVCISGLLVILPELIRNIITFGSIASKETSSDLFVPSLNIRFLLINLVENIGYNLPNTFFDISELINKIVYKTMYILYAGAEVPGKFMQFELGDPYAFHHDVAINPLITWLMIFAVIVSCILYLKNKGKKAKDGNLYSYAFVGILSFLIFCTFVGWYKFITRYEVGYFAILAPAVMLLFQYVFEKRIEYRYIFVGIVSFICIVSMGQLTTYHKKYMSFDQEMRTINYFSERWLFGQYTEIVDIVENNRYQEVGFLCGKDSYEYPLFQMFGDSIKRFEHVCVSNETAKYMDEAFVPECIIAVDVATEDTIEYNHNTYELLSDVSGVRLFSRMN